MDSQRELVLALRPVVELLDRLGVPYCVGGSVASSLHGVSRSTLDVDLSARLSTAQALEMCRQLSHDYYVNEATATDAVRRRTCFNLIHLATGFKVDIFVSKDRPFDATILARAAERVLGADEPLTVKVVSAEDVILLKLEWYRLGDCASERQWNDVTQVVKISGERLDWDYLRHWTKELRLEPLLERLFRETE
jgi:hypothetical protein